MRFKSARAHAFGALLGEDLELGPGLNVVYGPNEAGKSTWHAALYAGLCGMRRGRGQARAEDREFERRYRPVDRDEWRVSVSIELADGRAIDLRQDLDGRVDRRATDSLGRDVSSEIMNDGAPDGSRWLGLDRSSFLASACVQQADLLGVLEEPKRLQEHLQRAAATGGSDETAAAALERIDQFSRDHVGLERSTSTKPLRRAIDAEADAIGAVERARSEHAEYLHLVASADEAARRRQELVGELADLRAEAAKRTATALVERAKRAREIAERHPRGCPPEADPDGELAERVATAITIWSSQPDLPVLEGASASELRRELDELPAPPEGPVEVSAEIREAAQAYTDARNTLRVHERGRPQEPTPPASGPLDESELLDLVHVFEAEEPQPADPELVARAEGLRGAAARGRSVLGRILVAAGLAAAIVGAALALPEQSRLPGAGLFVLGVAIAGVGVWRRSRYVGALETLRAVESQLGVAERANEQWHGKRDAAAERARELHVQADPAALREAIREVRAADAQRRALEVWSERHAELARDERAASDELTGLLEAVGQVVTDGTGASAAFEDYAAECEQRAQLAARAARRPDLEQRIAEREQRELSAREARSRRDRADAALAEVARDAGVDAESSELRVAALHGWQEEHERDRAARKRAREEYARLETLLDGSSLEDLEAERDRAQREADDLAADLSGDAAPRDDDELEAARRDVESAWAAADGEANRLAGQLAERAHSLQSVPDAEEAREAARLELARVRNLERILRTTREFMQGAQARVHRDIAPRLADSIRQRLPGLCAGRYEDVKVDPETLEVRVNDRDGRPLTAEQLSHGTAEQVYLLLRLALAEHLCTDGEVCPLLLDDVTVQSDAGRTARILDLLHEIARERQVVLFSQEDEVLAWAEHHLDRTHDALIRLQSPAA